MMGRSALVLLAASVVAPMLASPLRAQVHWPHGKPHAPLLALAINDLSFGTVLPGIPSSVSVHDPRHAGLFEIQGSPGTVVRIEFVVPAALTSEQGALMPISFGPGDGFTDFSRGRARRGRFFDPHRPVVQFLGPNGRLYVRIGGTVRPQRPQASGTYTATIALTIYSLGS
jgi:hypothetical protein